MNTQRKCDIGSFSIGELEPLCVMSGPCVIESEEHTMRCAETLKEIALKLPINFVFKASYDKANRTSIDSFRGPGIDEGLKILEKVKRELGLPIITDVHTIEEAIQAADVCDILQIPAFLCRQTDLVVAAAKTMKPVHIKKGQFMAPWDMEQIIKKIRSCGNEKVIACDRGASFGYNNLVSDFRSIPIMQGFHVPVTYDASHSVQLPGGLGTSSGGDSKFIPVLSKAAVAAGCDAIFIESHPNPAQAKSDKATVFPLDALEKLLQQLTAIYEVVRT